MNSRGGFRIWLLIGFTVIPLAAGGVFMFLYSVGLIGLLAHGFTLRHWGHVLSDTSTWVSLGYSVLLGAASLGASLICALGLQAALGTRLRTGILRGLLFVPLAMPPLVAALASVQLWGNAGLLARLAHAAGLIAGPEEFPALLYGASGFGIVATHMLLVTPFLLLLLDRIARHQALAELEQVAATLGASRRQTWLRVSLPVLLRSSAPVLGVYFVVLMGAYEVPLLVGAQYPAMIAVLIQRRFSEFDLGTRPEAYVLSSLYACVAVGLLYGLLAVRTRYAPAARAACTETRP